MGFFFQTFKGSLLRSRWSNRAKFRIHSSFDTCHCYLQVWKGMDEKQPRKSGDTVFPIITLSVIMETSGRIWPNVELIQALMCVIITCKHEKDPIKNSGEKWETSFSHYKHMGIFFQTFKGSLLRSWWRHRVPIITLSVTMETSG